MLSIAVLAAKAAATAAIATVTVAPGQTMSGIAASHGLSLASVEAANPQIGNFNLIYPGETIHLSGGGSYTTSTSDHEPDGDSDDPVAYTAPAYTPPKASAPSYSSGGNVGGSFGACVRFKENTNSYSWGTGNGGGAYQFEPSTWAQFAPPGAAYGSASAAQQDQAFQNAVAAGDSGAWSQFDGC